LLVVVVVVVATAAHVRLRSATLVVHWVAAAHVGAAVLLWWPPTHVVRAARAALLLLAIALLPKVRLLAEVGVLSLIHATSVLVDGEGLDDLHHSVIEFITSVDIVPLRHLVVVSLFELLESKLVLSLFVQNGAILFQFVVTDGKLAVINEAVRKS